MLAGLLWAVIDPVLFSRPETNDAWMTYGVLAERWVREQQNGTLWLTYPNVCNTAGAVAYLSALVAAWRRQPAAAGVATVAAVALKLWWIGVLVRRYDSAGET